MMKNQNSEFAKNSEFWLGEPKRMTLCGLLAKPLHFLYTINPEQPVWGSAPISGSLPVNNSVNQGMLQLTCSGQPTN